MIFFLKMDMVLRLVSLAEIKRYKSTGAGFMKGLKSGLRLKSETFYETGPRCE